jgi:hypothetical protein
MMNAVDPWRLKGGLVSTLHPDLVSNLAFKRQLVPLRRGTSQPHRRIRRVIERPPGRDVAFTYFLSFDSAVLSLTTNERPRLYLSEACQSSTNCE